MTRFLRLFMLLSIISASVFAQDTTKVRIHNRTHLTFYGDFDAKGVLPAANLSFRKVYMDFFLSCPDGKNCAAFDYTVNIFAHHKTNKIDTIKRTAPAFRVEGSTPDSFKYSNTKTYTYTFNNTTKKTDSLANVIQKVVFNDSVDRPIDTIMVYLAGYKRYFYDNTGKKIDSAIVKVDSTLKQKFTNYSTYEPHYEDYEIARIITPYSQNRTKATFNFPYRFDVTDYRSLLTDTTEIRVFYSGYADGYTATCDFSFISGTPEREAYKVEKLWTGSYTFGDANRTIEADLVPKLIKIDSEAKGVKLKLLQTGHGFGGSGANCAEFCQKFNFVKVDGQQNYSTLVWRDNCGLNPLFSQTGTWIYDRANWCPGDLVDAYEYDLTKFVIPGQTHEIDLDMEAFINDGASNSSYIFGTNLIYYKEKKHTTDIEITDVLSPTNYAKYLRNNPVCTGAEVQIRNSGATTVNSIEFTYNLSGGGTGTYTYLEALAPEASAIVLLPTTDDFYPTTGGEMTFSVTASASGDINTQNNTFKTKCIIAPVYDSKIMVQIRTNNAGFETSYRITDVEGNEVYAHTDFENNKTYKDTIELIKGCYKFELLDSDKDGLSFFANNDGSGNAQIRKVTQSGVFKTINADFGTSVIQYFRVDGTNSISATANELNVDIYPNPSKETVNIAFENELNRNHTIQLIDATGKLVINNVANKGTDSFKLNTSEMTNGLYFLRIIGNDINLTKTIEILK